MSSDRTMPDEKNLNIMAKRVKKQRRFCIERRDKRNERTREICE